VLVNGRLELLSSILINNNNKRKILIKNKINKLLKPLINDYFHKITETKYVSSDM